MKQFREDGMTPMQPETPPSLEALQQEHPEEAAILRNPGEDGWMPYDEYLDTNGAEAPDGDAFLVKELDPTSEGRNLVVKTVTGSIEAYRALVKAGASDLMVSDRLLPEGEREPKF